MRLLRHRATLYRKTAVLGEGIAKKYSETAVGTFKCLAQPMSDRASAANGYDIGMGYTVFAKENQDVRVGDKLVVNGLTLYVAGVKKYINQPPVSHIEITALSKETS